MSAGEEAVVSNESGYHDGGAADVGELFRGAVDDLTGPLVTMVVIVALVKVAITITPRRFRPLTRLVGLVVTGVSFLAILS
jgi:hypothetical protein